MLLLLKKYDLFHSIRAFAEDNPVWGVCAGSILLAREVGNPEQDSLDCLPIRVIRNAYGSQRESFSISRLPVKLGERTEEIPADFIRAPRIQPLSDELSIGALYNGDPVFVSYNRILATTFHVELGESSVFHEYFVSLTEKNRVD